MKSEQELQRFIQSLDGKGYGGYKALKGTYLCGRYRLSIDHIQADPYAPPSKARLTLDHTTTAIPPVLIDSPSKRIAVTDFLARAFAAALSGLSASCPESRCISIDPCGQEILERTAVRITEHELEVRLEIELPAAGRRIQSRTAADIFRRALPRAVENALLYSAIDQAALARHMQLFLDQLDLRRQLNERGLVAFVANGAILPRESGASDKPLASGAVPFQSPQELEVSLTLPHRGVVRGMGVPCGVTLIAGGGYHGKSTLLRALERGVYAHIPGDGREMVVTRQDAVKIRAEDGRSISRVNIRPFISNLPGNKPTDRFTTANASGSTSQAANVMEALEAGASALLIDEDTSATNFMIRDSRMRQLVPAHKEPITPFVDRIRELYDEHGVSTVLVVGGSGDYFEAADVVLLMDAYIPADVTERAKAIAASASDTKRISTDSPPSSASLGRDRTRTFLRSGFVRGGEIPRCKAKGTHTLLIGKEPVDLSGLEQLVADSQTNALAAMTEYAIAKLLDDRLPAVEVVARLYERLEGSGLDLLSPYTSQPGRLALPRPQELLAALNRYRGLQVREAKAGG